MITVFAVFRYLLWPAVPCHTSSQLWHVQEVLFFVSQLFSGTVLCTVNVPWTVGILERECMCCTRVPVCMCYWRSNPGLKNGRQVSSHIPTPSSETSWPWTGSNPTPPSHRYCHSQPALVDILRHQRREAKRRIGSRWLRSHCCIELNLVWLSWGRGRVLHYIVGQTGLKLPIFSHLSLLSAAEIIAMLWQTLKIWKTWVWRDKHLLPLKRLEFSFQHPHLATYNHTASKSWGSSALFWLPLVSECTCVLTHAYPCTSTNKSCK